MKGASGNMENVNNMFQLAKTTKQFKQILKQIFIPKPMLLFYQIELCLSLSFFFFF